MMKPIGVLMEIQRGKRAVVAGLFLVSSERASIPALAKISWSGNIRRTSSRTASASQSVTEMDSRASAAGLGCVRGTTMALGFEAVTALGIYAIWHILQLFH
jgi:hypothetical protein